MSTQPESVKRVGMGLVLVLAIAGWQCVSAQQAEQSQDPAATGSDPAVEFDQYSDAEQAGDAAEKELASSDSGMFDTDRGVALADTDGDGFPDLTESMEMTNPLDATDFPGSDLADAADEAGDPGFPAAACRSGYRQVGSRLCISTNVHDARTYSNALVYCRDRRGRVASYGDLRYLYVRSSLDAAYNPNGRWIGNFVDDDKALCGNRSITTNNDPDIGNFEGECSRFNNRNFWCAHDRY